MKKIVKCAMLQCIYVSIAWLAVFSMAGTGLAEDTNGTKSEPAKKIRLHIIALDMKDQSKGLQQLKAISSAGQGSFTSADNLQQLDDAFKKVAQDTSTSTVVVEWPAGEGEKPQAGSNGPNEPPPDTQVKTLSIILVLLSLAVAITSYLIFRPEYVFYINEPECKPRGFKTRRRSIWIGRDTSCDVILKDPYVSKRHLEINMVKRGFNFEDNHTENGSFVDGKQVLNGFLPFGSRLTVGKTQVQIKKNQRA